VYHSTLDWRVIKKKKKEEERRSRRRRSRCTPGFRKVDVRLPGKGNSNSHLSLSEKVVGTVVRVAHRDDAERDELLDRLAHVGAVRVHLKSTSI